MKRSSGILMPIFSLPSPYGIGTLGKAAYDFVDFLAEAGQTWWQLLPVGPTSYGDSPYQSFSAHAGNPYFVDLELLCRDGLLTQAEIEAPDWGADSCRVAYEELYQNRLPLLQKATARGWQKDREAVADFTEQNQSWLPDYALFMAAKRRFGMKPWTEWPDEALRLHRPEVLEQYRTELAEDVRLFTYIQFLFFRQWQALRSYAHQKGVGIIGDLPIYVAMDSADVWAEPHCFQLDEHNLPREVAGVPPDFFSADGQLWGNPLYDWQTMQQDGYRWWIRRIQGASRLYDVMRIDHFRGLESYWAVPADAPNARGGRWVKGPGMALIDTLRQQFPQLQFIAEDLGFLTPEVEELLRQSGMPGMKILQFAFDSREPGNYLPHTYPAHSVCYAGTHDNAPLMAWKNEAAPEDIEEARRYWNLTEEEGFCWGVLRGGMSSVSNLFIAQLQDYLGLGAESRINTPGKLGDNWRWRLLPGQLLPQTTKRIAAMTRLYGRSADGWQTLP